ncbi:MAG: phosphopyruvate hydratase [Clostridia bacterium]|nr:phosphopyruvate hydratase [Clostridia bacterium]
MNTSIHYIKAREIIDSRGMPTVETTVCLCGGHKGVASVPSGASTGEYEAIELRDGDKKRYCGKGVIKAVNNVNTIIEDAMIGQKNTSVRAIDKIMLALDKTNNKANLGANATLSVSLALAKAHARALDIPLYKYLGGIYGNKLPIPMMNILNGGAHASNNIDIQEFMIVPCGFDTFKEALRAGCEIYQELKKILTKNGYSTSVGDEGGFAPNLSSEEEAIELIIEAINSAKYDTGSVKIALDIASSEWWAGNGIYNLPKANKSFTSDDLINKWEKFISKYPIISIEDPLGENDYDGWIKITERLGKKVMLVGDDLFVTNEKRLRMGIDKNMGNSILIKPNQIGTLTETLDVINLAKQKGYNTIISHRSGETDDTSISDIAVATNAGFIKTGAPCRVDRVAKYNRLLKIESEIYY